MDGIVDALAAEHAELAAALVGLADEGWSRPTRCDGWSVADVLLHLAQTDELAVGSAEGRFADALGTLARGVDGRDSVDAGADALVARERGREPGAVLARWQSGAQRLREVLAGSDPHRRVVWVAGELSIRTLATTRLAECWIHGGDIAEALGVTRVPTGRLRHVARLAWRTLPYAFARAGREPPGPVAFVLRGPRGEEWRFEPETAAATVIEGDGVELCLVAGRRVAPDETSLRGSGPDADAVLELVRTYA